MSHLGSLKIYWGYLEGSFEVSFGSSWSSLELIIIISSVKLVSTEMFKRVETKLLKMYCFQIKDSKIDIVVVPGESDV